MPGNDKARVAIRALKNGGNGIGSPIGGKDGKPDLQDVEALLGERAQLENALQRARIEAKMSGPIITKHFSGADVNDWHPGIGGEAGARWDNGLGIGVGGHYQQRDSFGQPAMWGGLTPSYQFGDPDGLWGEVGAMAGGIRKEDYNGGQVSPFALPRAGVGYGPVSADFTMIPSTGANKAPIGAVQFGLRKKF